MKKISFILAIVITLLSFSGCGKGEKNGSETTAAISDTTDAVTTATVSNRITKPLKDITDKLESSFDLSKIDFLYPEDEGADMILMMSYGIAEEDELAAIKDYAISSVVSQTARTVAMFVFEDDATQEMREQIKTAVEEHYVPSIQSNVQMYDPDEYNAALNYKFKFYDNALVLVIYYDTDNDAVFDVIEANMK